MGIPGNPNPNPNQNRSDEKGMPMTHEFGNGDAYHCTSGGNREALLGTRLMLLITGLWLGEGLNGVVAFTVIG